MEPKKIIASILIASTLFLGMLFSSNIWETLEADQIMVIQAPFSGKLTWYQTPGTKWQMFGTVTRYPKRSQLWFSSKLNQGQKSDESLKIRFNDGAHASISGSLSWEMPEDEETLNLVHAKFHSPENLEHQLLRTNLEKAVYMTGPLMSSAQSYAERRNDLLGLIEDQFLKGVYKTSFKEERQLDPLTNQSKTVRIVEPLKDSKTQEPLREEVSPLIALKIQVSNVSINDIKYDDVVEKQIQQQQQSIMAVQTAMAETKTAEQQALTVAAKGQAEAAEAEWKQKVLTAQATQEAEQKKLVAITAATMEKEVALTEAAKTYEVAQLKAQTAEQEKLAAILEGEGIAEAKKLAMSADGQLAQKLEAYVKVNLGYAQAISTATLVPGIMIGGTTTSNTGGATSTTSGSLAGVQDLISLMTAKTAKDLGVALDIPASSGPLREIKRPDPSKFKYVPPVSGNGSAPRPQNSKLTTGTDQ